MRPSIPTTSQSYADFIECIASSELISLDALNSACAEANDDPERMAELLTRNGLLTDFQLSMLRGGQSVSLRIGNYDVLMAMTTRSSTSVNPLLGEQGWGIDGASISFT